MTHDAFTAAGFTLFQNGGGCTAWRLDVTIGWYVLVTDSEGFSHWVDAGESWLVGIHSDDGFYPDQCEEAATVEEAVRLAKASAIAVVFVAGLEGEGCDMAEIRRRNATPDYDGPVCASHDFCDANMPMADAFESVTGRNPADDTTNESDAALWSDAWRIAKRELLTERN